MYQKKRFFELSIALVFLASSCTHQKPTQGGSYRNPSSSESVELNKPWSYDPGPDRNTDMGKELIDLVATQPYMPGISKEITGSQKFRPAFGPTLWRMIQKPNSVKILFIGQDGTHIAEAAGRTATAGFGGRAQDMAYHFGVSQSAAFMNAYAFTIKGQYSAFGVPVITEENGKKSLSYDSVTDNGIWLISQDLNSPMVKWRNGLIDWIIRNNRDSLKLVVLFGGAAQDAVGSFIESKGGKVGSRYSAEDLIAKKVKVPFFDSVSAGSNKEVPIALNKEMKDMYSQKNIIQYSMMSAEVTDKVTGKRSLSAEAKKANADLMQAKNFLKDNIATEYNNMAIPEGGISNSGVIHPAQIGGYDLAKIYINGEKTISLKNLPLSDGTKITNDILVAEFPHPTFLSSAEMTQKGAASTLIAKSLEQLKPMRDKGWVIQPDGDLKNKFITNEPYVYGRTDIPVDFYDFGTPKNRMVSVSSASRMPGKANIVTIGTRERATFDVKKLDAATKVPKAPGMYAEELFTARPRTMATRYDYDMGPGEKMARIMKENIDMSVIGQVKAGYVLPATVKMKPRQTIADVADISAFNIKSHPIEVGDFGHYRGTFQKPEVVILADPDGVDDILTSRALTGARGQYLQSLMNAMGVPEKYLVIKTVPFGMDGATDTEWKTVLSQTANYRKAILAEVLSNPSVKMIITDGTYASSEIKNVNTNNIPVVSIQKTGTENNSGIQDVVPAINKLALFNPIKIEIEYMNNIPRSHLGFFSRVWEGTSGTHVFDATSTTDRGIAYAIVAPEWSYAETAVVQSSEERKGVEALQNTLRTLKLPMANESYNAYKTRISNSK